MIVKNFDIGWGAEWPMKQLEQRLLAPVLDPYVNDSSKTVVINSVWYSNDYHLQVVQELHTIKPTHIVVVAMLDPPIIDLAWFDQFGCEVLGVGYYPNSDIDYFAHFIKNYYQTPACNLLDTSLIDTAYMCLNRKPHRHRIRLFESLQTAGILDHGFVSMGGNTHKRLLDNDVNGQNYAPNGGTEQYGIVNDIASLGSTNRWQRHFLNIVTETIWDIESCNFLSEKTYKPILGLRPFLIYAPNGGIECLRRRGFESYVNDFKDITDADLTQPYNVPVVLKELCKQPAGYYQNKLIALRDKMLYNQQKFQTYVSQQKHLL